MLKRQHPNIEGVQCLVKQKIYKTIWQHRKDFPWWTKSPRIQLLRLLVQLKPRWEGKRGCLRDGRGLGYFIILDACRGDYFKEVIGVNMDCRISRGLGTGEFIVENFCAWTKG